MGFWNGQFDDLAKLTAEPDHAKLDDAKLAHAELASGEVIFRASCEAKTQPIAGYDSVRDRAPGAKLLDQPLAGLNGKLQAKLIVSFKARLPSLGEAFSLMRSCKVKSHLEGGGE